MIFYVTTGKKRGKDEKWREINIVGLAGPLVSFGKLRLSTLTAQSLPRNPELTKRKAGLSFLSFSSPSLSLTPLQSATTLFSFLFVGLIVSFPFFPPHPPLLHSLRFVPSTVCSPEGIFQGSSNSLTGSKRPSACCIAALLKPVWGEDTILPLV